MIGGVSVMGVVGWSYIFLRGVFLKFFGAKVVKPQEVAGWVYHDPGGAKFLWRDLSGNFIRELGGIVIPFQVPSGYD